MLLNQRCYVIRHDRENSIDNSSAICQIGPSFRTAFLNPSRIGLVVDSTCSLRLLEREKRSGPPTCRWRLLRSRWGYEVCGAPHNRPQFAKKDWGQAQKILSREG